MRVRVKPELADGFFGFYGKRRRPGDEFDISDEKAFSEKWMEKVKRAGRPPKEPEVEKPET